MLKLPSSNLPENLQGVPYTFTLGETTQLHRKQLCLLTLYCAVIGHSSICRSCPPLIQEKISHQFTRATNLIIYLIVDYNMLWARELSHNYKYVWSNLKSWNSLSAVLHRGLHYYMEQPTKSSTSVVTVDAFRSGAASARSKHTKIYALLFYVSTKTLALFFVHTKTSDRPI